jgi:hypothetical protein
MTPVSRQFGQVVAAQYNFYTSAKDGFVFLVLVDSTVLPLQCSTNSA